MLHPPPVNDEPALQADPDEALSARVEAARRRPGPRTADRVDDAIADSFPASDPPGWWSGL